MRIRHKSATKRKRRARTTDIVGHVPDAEKVPARWRKHYTRLQALREQLLQRRGDLNRDALEEQPAFSTHMADAGTDAFDRDFALGVLSSEQDALYEIDEAINRIQTGTYGVCELTGKRIEPERLAAIPWTRFTAAAERQLEKQGEVKRARLGPRHAVVRAEASSASEEE